MIEYTLTRSSRSRSIRIRLDPGGKVLVSAPKLVPKIFIDQFVRKSEAWISRQARKNKLKNLANPILDWEQQLLSFMGNLYSFRFEAKAVEKVVVGKGVILVRPVTGDDKHVKQTLLKWLQLEAEKYFRREVPRYAAEMGINYKRLSFRQQSSRWGSCSSTGTLSFNWRLIHFKPEVIDYVIIHELAHVVHMNHSAEFWNLVRKYDLGYKDKIRFLKQQAMAIETD